MARSQIGESLNSDSTTLNGTANLFEPHDVTGNLTVFRAELVSAEQTDWMRLFAGFERLQAITFSSSLSFLIRLIPQFEDAEVVLGSERILTRQHAVLLQTSEIVEAYGIADALADHKALTEALARQLGETGQALLPRVLDGSLRFRLLRDKPSHEKLYLLTGSAGYRVIAGSANLSHQAFEAQQQEVYIAFDGEKAWSEFERYYQRDWRESCPIDADLLVIKNPDGEAKARTGPVDLIETPLARVIRAGTVIREEPARAEALEPTLTALREADKLGAELKEISLPKSKSGHTIVDAQTLVRVLRQHQARPVTEPSEDRLPRAQILFGSGQLVLDGSPWLSPGDSIPRDQIRQDAELMTEYIASFGLFFGDASGAVDAYWAFLVWLYSAPAAPYLRQAAIPAGIDPWLYPVYAVLYGRSSGGKTLFTRVAARSMFGFEKLIRSNSFTATRTLGLRHKLGAVPLLIDDVTRDKFTEHVPGLVRTDHDVGDCYAPVIITTNKDVAAIPADVSKRMVTCHIDAAIPENRSVTGTIARRLLKGMGTALFRAYITELIPQVRQMRAALDEGLPGFPDLLAASSQTLREIFRQHLGAAPGWARELSFHDYFGIRHRKFSEQLGAILLQSEERVTVDRTNGEVVVHFGGDTNQANQFARTVPDFVLKGRFADIVRLDLEALEKEMGIPVRSKSSLWRWLFRR